jgi:hypothetical protein
MGKNLMKRERQRLAAKRRFGTAPKRGQIAGRIIPCWLFDAGHVSRPGRAAIPKQNEQKIGREKRRQLI